MKLPSLILLGVAATLLATCTQAQEKVIPAQAQANSGKENSNLRDKDSIADSTKKIKDLQKERIAILKDLVEQLTTRFRSGRGPYEEACETRVMLHEAELAAAETQQERIALHKKMVEALSDYEKVAEARVQAARGTASDLLKVKARRLQAEIDLEQAKIKLAKESK